jgi:hypothetical protein
MILYSLWHKRECSHQMLLLIALHSFMTSCENATQGCRQFLSPISAKEALCRDLGRRMTHRAAFRQKNLSLLSLNSSTSKTKDLSFVVQEYISFPVHFLHDSLLVQVSSRVPLSLPSHSPKPTICLINLYFLLNHCLDSL